jgi:hypothetical protein
MVLQKTSLFKISYAKSYIKGLPLLSRLQLVLERQSDRQRTEIKANKIV